MVCVLPPGSLGSTHCGQLLCLPGSLQGALQTPGVAVWVLPGLADGQRSIRIGLIWGLPWLGGRGCTCLLCEGQVVQLGIGHILRVFRYRSLELGERKGTWLGRGGCTPWGSKGLARQEWP